MTTQKGGCCQDKQITVKTEKHTSGFQITYTSYFELSIETFSEAIISVSNLFSSKDIYSFPPGAKPEAIHKFYCVFLI